MHASGIVVGGGAHTPPSLLMMSELHTNANT